jgi:hypothetical protein
MKVKDFIFRTPIPGRTRHDVICRVRVFRTNDNGMVALLTDLGHKNTGASVTNSVEKIRQALILASHIERHTQIIEHYEELFLIDGPTFDLVTFNAKNRPQWQQIDLKQAEAICQAEEQELLSKTLEDSLLAQEIKKIRLQINPNVDELPPIPEQVIKRRAEIAANALSKTQIAESILASANEQEIQRLLKKDLSIFAETNAYPEEEYICFSEFPIGQGFVDFAVFSGRSRMDVTLIEVKGANFNFSNAGTRDLSVNIYKACQQFVNHLSSVEKIYMDFRERMHKIRAEVLSGTRLYSSFLGPYGLPHVDPDKDIKIHGVMIGGRSVKDLEESHMRHSWEKRFNPPISIESWDSWLDKLTRN